MNPLAEIALYILQTLGTLFIAVVLLRFVLQVLRADFYNPVSQFVVKASNPLVLPLRKVLPSIAGYDTASLVVALLCEALVIFLCGLLVGSVINPIQLLLWSLLGLVSMTVFVFYIAMIVMIVVSFLAPHSFHPAVTLIRQMTQPLCRPFQRLIPAIGGLDLSPIFVFMALHIVTILIRHGAAAVGLSGGARMLVPGI